MIELASVSSSSSSSSLSEKVEQRLIKASSSMHHGRPRSGELGVSLLREDEPANINTIPERRKKTKKTDGVSRGAMSSAIEADAKRNSTQYAIFFYYIWHGVSEELPVTALYLVLKEHFHLMPYQYSYIKSLNWIPWTLKPLFGYISDRYPIFGMRRCPYLAFGVVLGLFGWMLLASPWIEERWLYLTVMIVNSIATVMSETAVDSLIAEIARTETEEQLGWLQSLAWSCNSFGSIFGALTPIIAFTYGCHPRYILLMNGCVMGISGLSLPWMHEAEVLREVDNEHIMEALRNPLLVKALVFVFMVAASPTSGDAYQYFQSDVLHYSPAYISWTVVIFTTANFGAAYAYAAFLRKRNMRVLFRNVILFVILVGLFNIMVVERWNLVLGIPDKVFLLGDFVAQGVAGQLIFMPVAVFAARMSPAGGEGFVYALSMSVLNISWASSEFFSGLLAKLFGIESGEYDNLTPLIFTVSALTLIPLAFLHFVPELSKLGVERDDDGDGILKDDPEAGTNCHDVPYPASLPLLDTESADKREAILQGERTEELSGSFLPEGQK
jgi:MFS family permease